MDLGGDNAVRKSGVIGMATNFVLAISAQAEYTSGYNAKMKKQSLIHVSEKASIANALGSGLRDIFSRFVIQP